MEAKERSDLLCVLIGHENKDGAIFVFVICARKKQMFNKYLKDPAEREHGKFPGESHV